MPARPPLPDSFELPGHVNGWVHNPDSSKNGHVWTGENAERSVGVFSGISDRVRVAVSDDRVTGYSSSVQVVEREQETDETQADATAWGVERAVAWMEQHAPDEWDHPHVEEAAFDPPVGYELDTYCLGDRQHVVCYRREDVDDVLDYAGGHGLDTEPTLDTRAYLFIETWRGSGNSTIALSPWLRAHDHMMDEIIEPPEECGLEVALNHVREYVREQTGETRDRPAVGQSDLGGWSA